jgi:hypothetical protein
VESAVNQIVDKRFDKRQSVRWTQRGAHLLLQTRTRVLNGDLDQLIRSRYPAFKGSAVDDVAPLCDGLAGPLVNDCFLHLEHDHLLLGHLPHRPGNAADAVA